MRRTWIASLTLTNFRNYARASLTPDRRPVVLTGANGAGKTNLLEAISLLSPGRGLRRAAYGELIPAGSAAPWAVAAQAHNGEEEIALGTGLDPKAPDPARAGRLVKINGQFVKSSGALARHIQIVWLSPAMDGLFTGPAEERRRFLNRLILSFDPEYRTRVAQFERAMRQRNRILEFPGGSLKILESLETQMAEMGVAIAASRIEAIGRLTAGIRARSARTADEPFPWADLSLEGELEAALENGSALDVEDEYRLTLARSRERDRAAKRTTAGPHRSDLIVGHGPKGMLARRCSTGEQKALLVGLILAHADLVKRMRGGLAPVLLLDEIAAHLDEVRRAGLFEQIISLQAQAWMTGTDAAVFAPLGDAAQFFRAAHGSVSRPAGSPTGAP